MEELDGLAPEPGEEAALAAARAAMQKGARIAGDLGAVTDQLDGSDGALAGLRQAARRLDRLAAEHPRLASALEALDRAVIEASEAEDHLAEASRAFAFEPGELDRIETRLFDQRVRLHPVPGGCAGGGRGCTSCRGGRGRGGAPGASSTGSRPGCSSCAASPANTASSRTRWPRCRPSCPSGWR